MKTTLRAARLVALVGLSLAPSVASIAFADEVPPGMEGYRRSWHPQPAPPCGQPPCPPVYEAQPLPRPTPPYVPPPYVPPAYVPPPSPPAAPPCPPPEPPCPPPAFVPPPCPPEPVNVCRWVFTPRARAWWAVPAGEDLTITLGGEPGSGTAVDVDGDMDLESGLAWEVGLDATYDRHRLRGSYERLSNEGENTLERDVVFHGVTYVAGEDVTSQVDLTFWKLGWDYRLLGTNEGGLRVGAAGWVWTFRGEMEGSRSPKTSREFTHVYPVATLDLGARFESWTVGASANFGFLDTDRYFADLEARVGFRIGNFEIDVGYRWMKFVFHETTNEGDLVYNGPFVGLSYDI